MAKEKQDSDNYEYNNRSTFTTTDETDKIAAIVDWILELPVIFELPPKPTWKKFLENLRNINPNDYSKLESIYNNLINDKSLVNDKSLKYFEKYPTFESYIEWVLEALYSSKEIYEKVLKINFNRVFIDENINNSTQ